jgi:protein TonB
MLQPASSHAASRRYGAPSCTGNVTSFAITLALHAAAVALLLTYAPARETLTNAVPLMVNLVAPPEAVPDKPPRPLPATRPLTTRPTQPQATPSQPLLTTTAQAPTPVSVPPQSAEPAANQTLATTQQTPPTAPVSPLPASPAPTALSLSPPSFSADYLNNPAPEYPAISRKLGEQGRVVFRVYVGADGQPSDVRLQTSSGFERLDNVALAAIKRWKFLPARRGEIAVGAWVLVPLSFSLRS